MIATDQLGYLGHIEQLRGMVLRQPLAAQQFRSRIAL
jgi:hypothetical protein